MNTDVAGFTDTLTEPMADMAIARDLHHLLEIPAEIRLRLYYFLFAADRPILLGVYPDGRIYQPDHDMMREGVANDRISLSAQFLRTNKQLYYEGLAYLIFYNKFEILDKHTHNLEFANFTPSTRALMTNVGFLNRTNKPLRHRKLLHLPPHHRNPHSRPRCAPLYGRLRNGQITSLLHHPRLANIRTTRQSSPVFHRYQIDERRHR